MVDRDQRPIEQPCHAPGPQEQGCIVDTEWDVSRQWALQTEQAHLAAWVDSSQDAVIVQTCDGMITSWNPAAERLFGYSAEEVVGRSISTIVPPDRKDELLDVLLRVGSGEQVGHFDTVRQSKEGRRIPVSTCVSAIQDANGRIVGASTVDRDISRQRDEERQRNARLAVMEVLAQETALETAVVDTLAVACSALELDAGCFWRVEPDENVLRCHAFWQDASRDVSAFRAATMRTSFRSGEGLPGRVWKDGKAGRHAGFCSCATGKRRWPSWRVGLSCDRGKTIPGGYGILQHRAPGARR
jgi:PAS domain S-box-containing protein